MRTQRRSVVVLLAAAVVALLFASVSPASGGGSTGVGITLGDDYAASNGFSFDGQFDINGTSVDAFTNGAPAVSNPIVGLQGGELRLEDVGRNPDIVGRGLGIDILGDAAGTFTFADTTIEVDGPGEGDGTIVDLLYPVLEFNLENIDPDQAMEIGRFALSGVGDGLNRDDLLDPRPLLDSFVDADPELDDGELEALLDQLEEDLGAIFDDAEPTPREPGFLAHDLLGGAAPADQPIHTLRDGAILTATELQQPFRQPGEINLGELVINLQLDDPLTINGVEAPGGPPFVNDGFLNDAFNFSNLEGILRNREPNEPMLETQLFDGGGFLVADPVIPMGAQDAPHDALVVSLIPSAVVEQSSGIRFVNFVSATGEFGPGLVGTSSDNPIQDGLVERDFEPLELEKPRTIATRQVGEALETWLRGLGAISDGNPALPQDPDNVPPPTPDVVPDEPGAAGSDPIAQSDAPSSDDGFPWEPVAIGTGIVAIAGGYVATRKGKDDEETPVGVGPPPDEVTPAHTCDWELHWLNGSSWDKLRQVAPGDHACCIYKVEIETTTTMHFLTASFRQDVQPERLYIPDPDFSWSGLDFSGHAATRSGPAGRQDWQHGAGDPVDQSMLAPDEGFWQSSQGEERPEVAARIVHRETTTITVTLESGCVDASHVYDGGGDGRLTFLSTQECTNDDPVPGCPVELNAFGRALSQVSGDLAWKLTHVTGSDIDELERAGHLRPLWDSHDHEMLETATRPEEFAGRDHNRIESFTWRAQIDNEIAYDAAQIVPEHVWPTTERVSAWVGSDATYDIQVTGVMTKGDCEGRGCCGHEPQGHRCLCKPTFTLELDGDASVIKVDGTVTSIERDAPADRQDPPEWFRGGLTANPGIGVTRNWRTSP